MLRNAAWISFLACRVGVDVYVNVYVYVNDHVNQRVVSINNGWEGQQMNARYNANKNETRQEKKQYTTSTIRYDTIVLYYVVYSIIFDSIPFHSIRLLIQH